MHLDFRLPAGWTLERGPENESIVRAPVPDLVIVSPRLFPRGSLDASKLAASRCPPLTRVEHLQTVDLLTETGWPMKLATLAVVGVEGPLETRLAAVYEILHWTGFAMAIAANAEVYESAREELIQILLTIRPNLRGSEPVGVHELCDLD